MSISNKQPHWYFDLQGNFSQDGSLTGLALQEIHMSVLKFIISSNCAKNEKTIKEKITKNLPKTIHALLLDDVIPNCTLCRKFVEEHECFKLLETPMEKYIFYMKCEISLGKEKCDLRENEHIHPFISGKNFRKIENELQKN